MLQNGVHLLNRPAIEVGLFINYQLSDLYYLTGTTQTLHRASLDV